MSNFAARFLSTLGRLKEKNDWQYLTILISPVRNNFIKNLFTTKSRECRSLFLTGQASRPYNKIGIHLVHKRCKIAARIRHWPVNAPRRLCNALRLSVCLSVCLSVSNFTLKKTTERIFTKILPQMYPWTRMFPLKFGSNPDADSGSYILLGGRMRSLIALVLN